MTRLLLLPLLLLPGLAVGAANEGKLAFEKACARCHSVSPVTQDQQNKSSAASKIKPRQKRGRSMDLAPMVQQRTPEQLRTWIAGPHRLNPKTNCDTRLLPDSDRELLLNYLAVSLHPTPPTREDLLRQQLKKDLADRSAQKQRKANDAARRAQGKK